MAYNIPGLVFVYLYNIGHELDMMLDYGNQLYSVEIKSAATFNYDFLKGVNYYKAIAKEAKTKRFLVYAGDKSYETNTVKVYAYKDIQKLFDEINV